MITEPSALGERPAHAHDRRPLTQSLRAYRVNKPLFTGLAVTTAASYAVLVVTGGAVRLTGSGLGCPDWPSCYHSRFTAALSFHPIIEFGNRLFTVVVSVVSILAFLAAIRLAERRHDLVWLAGGLIAGLVAQIILGGIVVLENLNPYLVSLHFVLTLAVLADAVVLVFRARHGPPGHAFRLEPTLLWLSRLLLVVLTGLVCAGTIVSGAGPHAGAPGTERIPVSFRDITELHSDIALFLIGLTLATLFALHQARAPFDVQRRARLVFELMVVQGTLGYTQYFLHDSAAVVEVHLAGATALWIAMIWFYLHLRLPRPSVPVGGARG